VEGGIREGFVTAILRKPELIGQLGHVFQSQFANARIGVGREKQVADSLIRTPPRTIRCRFHGYKHTSLAVLIIGLVSIPTLHRPLLTLVPAPGIRFEPVLEERLVFALPSGHALEGLDRVSLETIADLPLIFFTRQLIPGFHAQIVELFQRVGAFPQVTQHAVYLQTIESVPPVSRTRTHSYTLDRYSHWIPSMGRATAEGMDEALG
jgi:hypothetical protein